MKGLEKKLYKEQLRLFDLLVVHTFSWKEEKR